MKKVNILLIAFLLTFLPCSAKRVSGENDNTDVQLPKIFIYHIPDDSEITQEIKDTTSANSPPNITSDDITADTSGNIIEEDDNLEEYEITDMYTDVLKGYAEYTDGEEDAIFLDDTIENPLSITIKTPSSIKDETHLIPSDSLFNKQYPIFNNKMEYSIAPVSTTNSTQKGKFSAGTMYDQGIDYAEFEQTTGLFTRYDTKYFAVSSAFKKTINSTNNNYNDNFYFAPELKLNQYFTLRETLSADMIKNTRSAEFTISINPFGNKDKSRVSVELGTKSIFDNTNALLKNQFKFSTNIKL